VSTRVLVVEDRGNLRALLVRSLQAAGFEVDEVPAADLATAQLASVSYAVVLTDVRLPGGSGTDVLAAARAQTVPPEVVLMTAYAEVPAAVEALRAGAYDYVAKPFEVDDMVRVVQRAAQRYALVNRARELEAALDSREGGGLLGHSPSIVAARERIERVGPIGVPVLLLGESGTGKEVAARELHRQFGRGPFVAVNCGAIPESLLEAELFGAARGAYSGAARDRAGLFEAADGGTLFLDEIGDMPLALQVKLNRAVEEGEIRRIGDTQPRAVSARLVTATHRDLAVMVEQGTFRADLYYRLRVVEIRLPPLRERKGDIALLSARFLQLASTRFGTRARALSPEALAVLEEHAWPGNVRELRHALESAAVVATGETIGVGDLPDWLRPSAPRASAGTFHEVVEAAQERAARAYLADLMRRHRGNVTRASEEAGVERETLHRLLKRHGVDAGVFREA
jgi:DNA-binding NtrC family response regulator